MALPAAGNRPREFLTATRWTPPGQQSGIPLDRKAPQVLGDPQAPLNRRELVDRPLPEACPVPAERFVGWSWVLGSR